jgi:DnaK suppressor protein
MFVSLLQLMGFPAGKPVHSRAEETRSENGRKAATARAATSDDVQDVPAGRQTVKAKSAKEVKVKKSSGKAEKAIKKGAQKTAVSPKVVAKKSPVKAVAPKAVAKPSGKAPSKSVVKTPAKAPAKTVAKSVTKTAVKAPVKAPVAKKPSSKVAAKPVPSTPTKTATRTVVKAPVKAAPKAVVKAVVKPPVKASAQPASQVQKPKVTAPAPAPAPKPVIAAKPVPTKAAPAVAVAQPAPAPAKAGRPSSRLAQLTVPSMAQSVASTAAKASYNQTEIAPVIAPVIPAIVKKDAKLANNWKSKPVNELTDAELIAMPDDEYMNEVQLAFFRLKLSDLKRDILASAGETTEHLREDSSVVPDPADRATIEEEHALELRTRDRERKLLKKIEQSIARIDAGDYGYCDETGEPIGVGRLLARPTATLSLEAQQRRELKQKMFGD